MKKISFKHKGRNLSIRAKPVSMFNPGLMFKSRDTGLILFEFRKQVSFNITSLFVFFPFVVVWLDENSKVIDVRKIKPFTFSINPGRKFKKIIEIPVNKKNKQIIKLLVGD